MSVMTEFEKRLLQENAELRNTIEQLTLTIESLNQTLAELREQLNKNSRNSSKPPSSDGLKKPAPKSLRKPSGKSAGGQRGHKGVNFSVTRKPDEIIPHMPECCVACPRYLTCKGKACVAEVRYVVDAVVDVKVMAHEALAVNCPMRNKTYKGVFPADVKGFVQYGENLQALVISLNTIGAVSVN